jgi:hypothetical protein
MRTMLLLALLLVAGCELTSGPAEVEKAPLPKCPDSYDYYMPCQH